MNDIFAEYDFTYALFVEANRLHRTKSLRSSIFYWLIFIGFPVFTTAVGLFALFAYQRGEDAGSLLSVFWVFVCYSVFIWLLRWVSFKRTYKNGFPKRLASHMVSLVISERGLHCVTSGEVETDLPWTSLCRLVHNDNLALLYYSRTRFVPAPKSSFADADWQAFLALSAQKLGGRKC